MSDRKTYNGMYMKYLSRSLLALALIMSAAIIFSFSSQVQAQDSLSEPQIEAIRQNCTDAQVTMQRVQHSDIATRINTGRAYDALITRQMAPLNSRASLNRISIAPLLAEDTRSLENVLSSFRDHYNEYTDTLSRALRVKCQDKPEEFYGYVQDARQLRKDLSEDIKNLKKLTEEYGREVDDYISELKKVESE